jgi:predicted DNA-binding protein
MARKGAPMQAWIEQELKEQMEALAARTGRTVSAELRRAVIFYLRDEAQWLAPLSEDEQRRVARAARSRNRPDEEEPQQQEGGSAAD